jgi:phospholipid-translocating ATPase
MIASLVLFESDFLNIVSISFTALVLNELIMVAVEVTTWHTLMILSEVFTLALYIVSIYFLPEYFGQFFLLIFLHAFTDDELKKDLSFVLTTRFLWKVGLIVAISAVPLWALKVLKSRFAPTQYAKLRDF